MIVRMCDKFKEKLWPLLLWQEKQCQGQLLTVLVIWGICLTAEGILDPAEREVSKCKIVLVDLFILWWIILKKSNTGQMYGVSDCVSVRWWGG